jgi:hypothetical protein
MKSTQELVKPLSNSVKVSVDSIQEKVVPLSNQIAVSMQSVEGDVLPPSKVVDNSCTPLSRSQSKKRKKGSSNTDDEVVQTMKQNLRPQTKKVINSGSVVDSTPLDATIALTANKQKKPVINVDQIHNPPPSSDLSDM